MKHTDSNQAVYWSLLEVMHQAKHQIAIIAEAHKLTQMQANTLVMLQVNETLTMKALSDYFACDASNITGVIDRIEARGLIERQSHPTDRRAKCITLTESGEALSKQIMADTMAAEAARIDPALTKDEKTALHALLQKILSLSRPH